MLQHVRQELPVELLLLRLQRLHPKSRQRLQLYLLLRAAQHRLFLQRQDLQLLLLSRLTSKDCHG